MRISTIVVCLWMLIPSTAWASTSSETARIQAHLEEVLRELSSATPPFPAHRDRARQETLVWLAEYRERGIFPRNYVAPNERVPIFVDPHGTPCAVGYLLLRSGEGDLVEEIVRTNNLARVPDFAGHVRFGDWLAKRGITLEEAARIQPSYGGNGDTPDDGESVYVPATVTLSVLTAALTSYALMTAPEPDDGPWIEFLGTWLSIGHLYLVASGRYDVDDSTTLRAMNTTGVVASAIVVGARIAQRNARRSPAASSDTAVRVAPFLEPRGEGATIGLRLTH